MVVAFLVTCKNMNRLRGKKNITADSRRVCVSSPPCLDDGNCV